MFVFLLDVPIFIYCSFCCFFFFFKQKSAYDMRISDWSSDVCSSDLSCLCCLWRGLYRHILVLALGLRRNPPRSLGCHRRCGLPLRYRHHHAGAAQPSSLKPSLNARAHAGGEVGIMGALSVPAMRSEEHTSELQSLMRISYAPSLTYPYGPLLSLTAALPIGSCFCCLWRGLSRHFLVLAWGLRRNPPSSLGFHRRCGLPLRYRHHHAGAAQPSSLKPSLNARAHAGGEVGIMGALSVPAMMGDTASDPACRGAGKRGETVARKSTRLNYSH